MSCVFQVAAVVVYPWMKQRTESKTIEIFRAIMGVKNLEL